MAIDKTDYRTVDGKRYYRITCHFDKPMALQRATFERKNGRRAKVFKSRSKYNRNDYCVYVR